MKAVNKSMAKGTMWTVLFRFVTRGLGLLSTVILARLLVPADFGLVAIAMAIIAALEVLSAFNLDVVLIQNQGAERKHYDTAWTFNFIAGAIQALILVLLAPWVADFYADARLTAIIWLLALSRLIGGAENIGLVAFRKDLQFHRDFKFQVVKKLLGFIITMILAFWLRNYWALIGGMLAGTIAGVLLSFGMQHYRPKFSIEATGELFHFSKWLLVNNLLYFFIHQSSSFILGKIGGTHVLGLFTVSYEVANLPSTDLVAPINRAIFPGYAKMAGDMLVLRQGFLNVFSAISLFVLPVGVGIVLTAEPLVHLLLGDKWSEAIPLIQVLTISGSIVALQTNQGSIYLALGRPKVLTLLGALHAGLLVPALIMGAKTSGAEGAATAILLVSVLVAPVNFGFILNTLDLKFRALVDVFWRPLLSVSLMYVAVVWLQSSFGGESTAFSHVYRLLVSALVGALVYSASILLLCKLSGVDSGVEILIINETKKRFEFLRAKLSGALGPGPQHRQ